MTGQENTSGGGTPLLNPVAVVRKPRKMPERYRTNYTLIDGEPRDKQLYDIINNGVGAMSFGSYNAELLARYIAFIGLTGARRTDPFRHPPVVNKVIDPQDGQLYYTVYRDDGKHFLKTAKRKNDIIISTDTGKRSKKAADTYEIPRRVRVHQVIRCDGPYQQYLWDLVMNGQSGKNLVRNAINFRPLLNPRGTHTKELEELDKPIGVANEKIINKLMVILTQRVQRTFKANLMNEDGEKVGLVPLNIHNLRHALADRMLLEDQLPPLLIMRNMNWTQGMLYYYTSLQNGLNQADIIRMYRQRPQDPAVLKVKESMVKKALSD